MGVPTRRTSKANKRMRRANHNISKPALSECPQCHAFKKPHHACPECGYYKGKEVIAKAE
ncbi:MAG: 50S ribosomal protein L32 [Desulfitobacteriaceae bacterium]|nr:50S ribosomal protein L32 [Desulfitobacteriaceae bacterium]